MQPDIRLKALPPLVVDMEGVEAILREQCDNCTEDNICRECYLAREEGQA